MTPRERAGGVETSAAWHPQTNPWVIAVSVMLATFMEVLDTSVANVALPHIAGSLSASTDEATLGSHELSRVERHRAAGHAMAEQRLRA